MAPIGDRKRDADAVQTTTTTEGSAAITCKKRRIGSDYEEVSSLGKGGFGVVVKARHVVTGKSVAVKFASSEKGSAIGALLREACYLDACDGNPHVVGYESLERDQATGELCLVMEYVGRSVDAFLKERFPLPEATVRSFMFQLLTGVKEMEDCQIIHRDIKPANVLVADDDQLVKICDLGLAMSISEPTRHDQAGTIPYMAPETLLGETDYTARVDSWSLGCVMAKIIKGKTLFQHPNQGSSRNKQFVQQVCNIFELLGMPNGRTWPKFASLPSSVTNWSGWPHGKKRSRLRQKFPEKMLSKDGFQVMKGLLTCNPDKRLSAAAALQLPWFAPLRATARYCC